MPNRALGYHFLKPRKSLQRGIFLCIAHGCFAFAYGLKQKGKNHANHGDARVSKSGNLAGQKRDEKRGFRKDTCSLKKEVMQGFKKSNNLVWERRGDKILVEKSKTSYKNWSVRGRGVGLFLSSLIPEQAS